MPVVYARAPASSANLGPGFDVLALALDLHVEVTLTESDRLAVTSSGEGADLPVSADHLAARVVRAVAGHDRFHLRVHSDIPVGRGMGSSAALAVAAAAAALAATSETDAVPAAGGGLDVAGAWAQGTSVDGLDVAGAWAQGMVVDGPDVAAACAQGMAVDGHPENAAASAYGGLVAATAIEGRVAVRRLALDDELIAVLVVPDQHLPTAEARAALPASVPFADATFNLGRLGLLVAGLADRRQLLPEAFEDRLHQTARGRLFPEAARLLAALRHGGALGACWSGAGPSLLGLCARSSAAEVAEAAGAALSDAGVAGRVVVAGVDHRGVVCRPDG